MTNTTQDKPSTSSGIAVLTIPKEVAHTDRDCTLCVVAENEAEVDRIIESQDWNRMVLFQRGRTKQGPAYRILKGFDLDGQIIPRNAC